ncbi:hypothetical protein [Streptomyces hygroscopicus]|uniref:hypothetical protein n=1 Tax=Streptomyces hygroscopicus TaxID=1912 RepID=UPI0033C35A32
MSHETQRSLENRGWNRLTVGSLAGDECALRPLDYTHLIEAQNTLRARYGGYGPCIAAGECETCSIFQAEPKEFHSLDDRVLVRFGRDGSPYLMNRAEDGWGSPAERWTWQDLLRITGWTVGRRHSDEHGDGFWLIRAAS